MSNPSSPSRKRVLSGMRPTGKLHLGNYMGALHNWVRLQDEYECYFFIADVHALTTDYADPSQIPANTREVILDYLAAGLDPEKSVLFVQSQVKQHFELPLLLGMITPLGWLERVPSYKEMQENLTSKDLTTYGFLGYPVLMASDILLYQANFVPVGQDQTAHVELTREIARRFNQFYPPAKLQTTEEVVGEDAALKGLGTLYGVDDPKGALEELYESQQLGNIQSPKPIGALRRAAQIKRILPEPQVLLTPSPKLPGTDGRKMSKSYGNTILMSDPEAQIRARLKPMVTDPARVRRTDPGNPDKCPVGDLHKIFSSQETLAKVYDGCTTAGIGCIECKGWAADGIVQHLAPLQERRSHFEQNPPLVTDILHEGARRAGERAEQTMQEVRSAMGLAGISA
ncbi:MAG TPA: tryptophan--tRNA ligase [Acidobacteriaceae bacterium]|nr:tryptophan--tRNA ligase [Acidobacteriaceae bacterium]